MQDKPRLLHVLIGTTLGAGFCPVAPGTAGAVVGVAVWAVLQWQLTATTLMATMAVLTLLFTLLGAWSATHLERYWGPDPSRVVIDETVGVWLPLIIVGPGQWWQAVAALALFRFFDIVKPLGVRRMEQLPAGIGVMADDVLAGIYSLIIIAAWQLTLTRGIC